MRLTQRYRWLSFTHGRPPLIPLSLVRIESTSYFAFSNVPRGSTTLSLAYFDATMYVLFFFSSFFPSNL